MECVQTRPAPPGAHPAGSPAGTARRVAVEVGLGVGAPTDKARDLRRMKTLATGLLLGAAVIFLLARWGEAAGAPGWVGYVRATAEAAMVGALADWFAVTALFRQPLGLPIPHTAIIPRKKDQIGDSLGDFVGENFLAEDVVRDKLGRVEVARRVGEWIGQVPNADRVTAELATAAKRRRDRAARRGRAGGHRPGPGPQAARAAGRARRSGAVLEGVLADGAHHRLVDLVCDKAYDWVTANHDDRAADRRAAGAELVATVRRRDHRGPGVPRGAELRLGGEDRPGAPAAQGHRHLPRRVRRRPAARPGDDRAGRADQVPDRRAPRRAAVHRPGVEHGQEARARRRGGPVVARCGCGCATGCWRSARGCPRTPSCAARSTAGWSGAAGYVVRHYRREITTLITDTVARWDADETSRKVELQVGRDLQFIRINGTVVGALAGLVIYTVSQLVFGGRALAAVTVQAGRLQEQALRRSVGRVGTAGGPDAPGEQAGGPVGSAVGQAVGDIGAYIRAQREHARVSLRQLARTAGVSNPYLSQIERGLRTPSAEILAADRPRHCGSPPRRSTCGPGSWSSGPRAPSRTRSSPTPTSPSGRSTCCSRSTSPSAGKAPAPTIRSD